MESHFEDDMVLDLIVLSAFWAFIFGRIGFGITHFSVFVGHWMRIFLLINFPGVERWGALIGILCACLYWLRKKKGKYFDYLDLVTLGYFSGVVYFWLGINFINFYWQNMVLAVINFLAFVLFWKLEKTYRLISWYRSNKSFAKSGFVSGFGLSAIGLLYFLETVLFRQMGSLSTIWSICLLILGLLIVYIRSGRTLADDIKTLKSWNNKNKK